MIAEELHIASDDDITDTKPAPPTLDDYTETTCDLLQTARLRLERILRECQRAIQGHDHA